MSRRVKICSVSAALAVLSLCIALATGVSAQDKGALRYERSIALPGVTGRIDHMAVDGSGRLLFVAALGNNTVEVVDLAEGRRVRSLTGLKHPQGVAFLDDFQRLYVTNEGDGSCRVYEAGSLSPAATIGFSNDADNIHYNPKEKLVYVGYGDGFLGVVDAGSVRRVGDIRLSGHPESFQIELNGSKIFVNVPSSRRVEVVDRSQRKVIASWTLGEAGENFPMALDESGRRLFIGCRRPARVVLLDTESGNIAGSLGIAGDVDDLFLDDSSKLLFASCGEGYLQVFRQEAKDRYVPVQKLVTARGARTSLLDVKGKRLYLAVPAGAGREAEIRVYAVAM